MNKCEIGQSAGSLSAPQRLSRKGVHSSEWKRVATIIYMVEDIVYSAVKAAAGYNSG